MMKRKYKITFEIDAHYPMVDTHLKKLSKDFDMWLVEWATSEDNAPTPLLFIPSKHGAVEQPPNAHVKVKIVRDGETILDTAWDQLSDDF
jgi:hypothetical protein